MTEPIVKMVFGSHLYGLNHADSDTDYKGVVFPTAKQILLQEADFHISKSTGAAHEKNGAGDVDEEYFSLMKFLKLAMNGETVAIDMLHAPKSAIMTSNYFWHFIVDNRSRFYTKNMKAYIGYVRRQAAKYGVKGSRLAAVEEVLNMAKQFESDTVETRVEDFMSLWPKNEYVRVVESENGAGHQVFLEVCGRKFQTTLKMSVFIDNLQRVYDNYGERAKAAKENKGVDWKAVSHALRAGYQAYHIYPDGGFSYPLPETDFLFDVKMGKLDYVTEVAPVLEKLVDDVERLAEESDYPETVDREFWNNWLITVHRDIVGCMR